MFILLGMITSFAFVEEVDYETIFDNDPRARELKTGEQVTLDKFIFEVIDKNEDIANLEKRLEGLNWNLIWRYWDGDVKAFLEFFEKYPGCAQL